MESGKKSRRRIDEDRNEGSKVRQRGRTLWFRRWPVVTSPVGSTAVRDGRKEDAGEGRYGRRCKRESKREVGGGGGGRSVGRETEPSYPRNRFSSLSTACRARLPPSSSLLLYLRDMALRVIRGLCSPRSAGVLAIGPCTCL